MPNSAEAVGEVGGVATRANFGEWRAGHGMFGYRSHHLHQPLLYSRVSKGLTGSPESKRLCVEFILGSNKRLSLFIEGGK